MPEAQQMACVPLALAQGSGRVAAAAAGLNDTPEHCHLF